MNLDNIAAETPEVEIEVPVVRCVGGHWVERQVTSLDYRKIPITRTVRVYRAFSNVPRINQTGGK